jgi:hypothetical protein
VPVTQRHGYRKLSLQGGRMTLFHTTGLEVGRAKSENQLSKMASCISNTFYNSIYQGSDAEFRHPYPLTASDRRG